jgi:hypothetical protein
MKFGEMCSVAAASAKNAVAIWRADSDGISRLLSGPSK